MGFITWVRELMNEYEMGNNEFARKGGLPKSTASETLNENREVDYEFCVGVSKAFDIPLEFVQRKAGLLPQKNESFTYQELVAHLSEMSVAEQNEVLRYVLFQKTKTARTSGKSATSDATN